MGTAAPQSDDVALPSSTQSALEDTSQNLTIPVALAEELWLAAKAEDLDLTRTEFVAKLIQVGSKHNCNQQPGVVPTSTDVEVFFRSLHLADLALAHACALGQESAWRRFIAQYQTALIQTAMAIADSATLAHDLADSLYSDLYGMNEKDGKRKSPLESYSGRGPLISWLRTALVQKHANYHRRVRHEVPLGTQDIPEPAASEDSVSSALEHVQDALVITLGGLSANERFLLAAYFLDHRTLAQIGQLLQVHEATASRKLKRLTKVLRKRLIQELQSTGLSKRAAEEAIGIDPRDLTIDVRSLLQSMPVKAFIDQKPSSEQSL